MEVCLKRYVIAALILLFPMSAIAADYDVDLGQILDLEDIRPLVEECGDIGELEDHRDALDSATDLETLRSFLEDIGYVSFRDCPAGIEGSGIDWVY